MVTIDLDNKIGGALLNIVKHHIIKNALGEKIKKTEEQIKKKKEKLKS